MAPGEGKAGDSDVGTKTQKLSLVYVDSAFWRAEVPRLAFFIGGVDFEDKRLTSEEFREKKSEFPFGQIPVLYVDGKSVAQSGGICRFAGKKAGKGLYPRDDFLAAKVDEVIDFASDMTSKVAPSLREKDPEKRVEMRKVLAEETLPNCFAMLERVLKENGANSNYFVGNSLTIADLAIWRIMWWFTNGILDGIPKDIAAPFTGLCRVINTVDSHPKVVEWKEKYPQHYKKD
uniref:Glutathione S-transferase n=2 Tax=Sar TaxID=2698737 RepID=A0A6S8BHM6_9STRA|mmetsp:Transcript_9706/g.12119  ORF Transcript_9706/g.12119 Transcript_9706/m.12119 type:complete len:232 (+) Transcript_9706:302-997(+)